MKFRVLICSFFSLLIIDCFSQSRCNYSFKQDSCALNIPTIKELAEVMEVKIKNDYLIQFIKKGANNYFKIIVKDNLGFGKNGSLLIQSSKRQIYIKSITLQSIDNKSGYFLLELNNTKYLQHLKDYGMSNILFNEKSEFIIPNSDSDQIEKAANCFYNQVKETIEPALKKP
jgi:hypothetical protein